MTCTISNGTAYLHNFVNLFFTRYGDHRDLHSFPTRRSSDLRLLPPAGGRARERRGRRPVLSGTRERSGGFIVLRSEEHTSELQSHSDLVCRLLLEKKKSF